MAKTVLHIAEASGGVERYLLTLLAKLKKYSEYEHILVCSETFDRAKFRGLVKHITVVKEMHNAISVDSDLKAVLAVRKAIKHYKPDYVYCHSSKAGAIGRIANIGIKNKLIYNAHGWSFNMKGAGAYRIKFYEIIERLLAPMTDKIICISEYEKRSALLHKICKEDKLVVINNGIDKDEYNDIYKKCRYDLGIPENAFVVGMIGRLCNQKAPEVFVQMACEVKKNVSEAFFIIVGDDIGAGGFRKRIDRLIEKNGLKDSFFISGWVDDPLDYVDVFDVATLLSRWEGFGLVLAEYMEMGKPIVATKADAIPYVIGDAGLLVDIDDYVQASKEVIRLYNDINLRNKLVEKGKERVKLFDVQRTALETMAIFDEMKGL